jgi:hypothetical protein
MMSRSEFELVVADLKVLTVLGTGFQIVVRIIRLSLILYPFDNTNERRDDTAMYHQSAIKACVVPLPRRGEIWCLSYCIQVYRW